MNTKTLKNLTLITFATITITFIMWLPHFLNIHSFYNLDFSAGFNNIYRNYDGLEYVVIAKSLYFPEAIALLPQSQEAIYYAAHFPGYALLILFFAPLLGFLKSMLFVTLLFTILSAIAFYFLVKNFKLTNHPLILSLLFLILPARWLIVHSVGAAEPVFIFFTIMCFYYFLKFEQTLKYLFIVLTGVFGMLAQITRPPGILIFAALGLYILWKFIQSKNWSAKNISKFLFSYFPIFLIPLSVLSIFYWYSISYGDFWAYFNTGDNRHLVFPPFQVFNKADYWVGDIWLEDIVYILTLGFLGGMMLLKNSVTKPLAFFVLIYLAATAMVTHRDISRYALPVFPFVMIAFEKVLTSKEFRIVLIIVGLAIYLYSQNYIIANTAPIPNLEAFD